MTGLAFLAFLAFVLVILLVTRIAVLLQLVLVQIAFVTGDTFGLAVLAKQLVFGLSVMIKNDLFPALVVVTGLALGAKFSLVTFFLVVVLFVTGKAIHLELVLIDVALVTFDTFDVVMLSAQRKFCFPVVIKWNFFPAAFDMAGFALGAEFSLVPFSLVIVLLVAGDTLLLELVLVQVALMASGALRFLVFAQQRILGTLVVVEDDLFPSLHVVTGLAFGTEFSLVPFLPVIVLLVTVVAQLGCVFVLIVDMTLCTFHVFVLIQQIELGLAVVEVHGLPVFFLVAILALGSQSALMLVGLLMATVALGGGVAIFLQRRMAVLAKDFAVCMSAFKGKAGGLMIEVDRIHFYNARVAAFVFSVTLFARLLFLHQAVIAPLLRNFLADIFVTIFAQIGLGRFVVWFMAVVTVALIFDMPDDDFTRHQ